MRSPSAAEAKLDARIRPDITVLRSVTPYPRRHRPALTVLDGGIDNGQAARPAGYETANPARPEVASPIRSAAVTRPQAVPAEAATGPVRLTRRGKIVLWVLAMVTMASAAALIGLAVAGRAQAAQQVRQGAAGIHGMLRVVVRPGQTLWSIAVRADPAADPRLVIQQIIDENALRGTALQAGQVLWVPRL
jgi:LysM domain